MPWDHFWATRTTTLSAYGATFGPLVCWLILKLLYNNLKQYVRLNKEQSFSTRCSILCRILPICLCAICKIMRVLLLHFDVGYYAIRLRDEMLRHRFDKVTSLLITFCTECQLSHATSRLCRLLITYPWQTHTYGNTDGPFLPAHRIWLIDTMIVYFCCCFFCSHTHSMIIGEDSEHI